MNKVPSTPEKAFLQAPDSMESSPFEAHSLPDVCFFFFFLHISKAVLTLFFFNFYFILEYSQVFSKVIQLYIHMYLFPFRLLQNIE